MLLQLQFAKACDFCSVYLDINPNDYKNSFTLRHRFRSFTGNNSAIIYNTNARLSSGARLAHGVNDHNTQTEYYTMQEQYNAYELAANIYLNKKWQVNATMPFADNYLLKNDSVIDNIGGIGDLQLLVKYQLFSSFASVNDSAKSGLVNRFIVGGGIKLPTGKFNKTSVIGYNTTITPNTILGSPITELDPHFQAGTGSVDYIFLLEYLLKWKNFGLNNNTSIKVNSKNKNNFKFANRINANSSLFYLSEISNDFKVMFHTGVTFETSNRDKKDGIDYKNSGGEILFSNVGISFFVYKLELGTTYYTPIHELLYDNQLNNNYRVISNISYYF